MEHFLILLVLVVPVRLNEVQVVTSSHLVRDVDIIIRPSLGNLKYIPGQRILLLTWFLTFQFTFLLTEKPSLVAQN